MKEMKDNSAAKSKIMSTRDIELLAALIYRDIAAYIKPVQIPDQEKVKHSNTEELIWKGGYIMKIIGYQRADFAGEDGKQIKGNNIYIATEINPHCGAGIRVERSYLTDNKCEREGIDLAALLDQEIKVYYNRYGKIDSIVLADA